MDIPRAASSFHFFGTAAGRLATEAHVQEGVAVNYSGRHPVGVVGGISPWTRPFYLFI